jgi:hypothetical protein
VRRPPIQSLTGHGVTERTLRMNPPCGAEAVRKSATGYMPLIVRRRQVSGRHQKPVMLPSEPRRRAAGGQRARFPPGVRPPATTWPPPTTVPTSASSASAAPANRREHGSRFTVGGEDGGYELLQPCVEAGIAISHDEEEDESVEPRAPACARSRRKGWTTAVGAPRARTSRSPPDPPRNLPPQLQRCDLERLPAGNDQHPHVVVKQLVRKRETASRDSRDSPEQPRYMTTNWWKHDSCDTIRDPSPKAGSRLSC